MSFEVLASEKRVARPFIDMPPVGRRNARGRLSGFPYGCVENTWARGLVLRIVPWGVESDHGSAWLDNADAVSPAGRATAIGALDQPRARSVESLSKRICPTFLTIGLIFEVSIVCGLLVESLFPFPLEGS